MRRIVLIRGVRDTEERDSEFAKDFFSTLKVEVFIRLPNSPEETILDAKAQGRYKGKAVSSYPRVYVIEYDVWDHPGGGDLGGLPPKDKFQVVSVWNNPTHDELSEAVVMLTRGK
jgi:hypothetical protein